MFSKPKIAEQPASGSAPAPAPAEKDRAASGMAAAPPGAERAQPSYPARPKPSPSLIASDLVITGNVETPGDIQIEGTVEGDVRAHLLTLGESAVVRGEIVAEDVVVHGRVTGRVRGLKVRLTASARVEGDIVHKTIAIESGAHFEGSVSRQEDPIAAGPRAAIPDMTAAGPGEDAKG